MKTISIVLNSIELKVRFHRYANKRKGFSILTNDESKNFGSATLNYEKYEVEPNTVIVKDYGDFAGLPKALENIGFLKMTSRKMNMGSPANNGVFCILKEPYKKY